MNKALWMISILLVVLVIYFVVFLSKDRNEVQNTQAPKENIKNVQKNLPKPKHIVIVVGENHSYDQIIGDHDAPFINALAKKGVLFTDSHGIIHPSQPNYLALFSGDTQGVTDDSCPHTFRAENLATALKKQGKTFAGYFEDLPSIGFKGCRYHDYHRKHSPWVNFSNVPASSNLSFTMFPTDYNQLPTVSFVIPNLENDMHDGTVKEMDTWLNKNVNSYIQWASSHNSLFILTWDEDNFKRPNQIPTIFAGPMVKPGKNDNYMNHYSILRIIEDLYGLPKLGKTKSVSPIHDIWKK